MLSSAGCLHVVASSNVPQAGYGGLSPIKINPASGFQPPLDQNWIEVVVLWGYYLFVCFLFLFLFFPSYLASIASVTILQKVK